MNHKAICHFKDVTEHDIDLLMIEEFASSKAFLKLFTDKIGVKSATVHTIYSSKTDALLGESDITVILKSNDEVVALLIENKIDAIAMPEQAKRYFLRGNKGLKTGEYARFFVFITAPHKYLITNKEAKLYPNYVEYEEIISYFKRLHDSRSHFKIQQLQYAIDQQKKGYQIEEDPDVTLFWRNYSKYQKQHYPDLNLIYNGSIKGTKATWPKFNTIVHNLNIYHKTASGFVDLTFSGYGDKIVTIENLLEESINNYLDKGYSVKKTGKSAAIRITVSKIDFHKSFEEQITYVDEGLSAVRKLANLVKKNGLRFLKH